MPLRIPKNQIVFNYTSGKEYLVLSTKKEYQGHYYEINGKFFAGKEFNVNAPEIVKSTSNRLNQNETQNSDIDLYNKISGLALDIINIVALPKLDDPNVDKEGTDTYYTKKHNDVVIKQIDKDTYNTIKSNPLYSTVVIKGDLSNLSEAEKQIPNITLFVKPLPNFSLADVPYIINTPLEPTIKPTPVTSSISTSPKPQDIIPVGPIYEKGAIFIPPTPPTPPIPLALRLIWNDIGDVPVVDPTNVAQWNTQFDLPGFGNPFTSVIVTGDVVELYGGSGINLSFYALSSTNIIEIDDQAGCIVSMEDNALGSTNLTTVNLPALSYASADGFANCYSLTSVNIPLVTEINDSCFYNCTSLTSVNISSVTGIGSYAFYNCSSLLSISLPFVTYLADNVFNGCTSLTSADLPLVTEASDYCFYNCASLTSVNLPLLNYIGSFVFWSCGLQSISLPSLVDTGDHTFSGCSDLVSADLPSLSTVLTYYFADCYALTTVNIPSATSLSQNSFNGCENLVSISLPSVIDIVGESCFTNCNLLQSFNAPLLETIDNYCFENCISLTTFNAPSLISVGEGSFVGCSNLGSISLPVATSIGPTCFSSCYNLASVSFPLATFIGGTCFENCYNLTSISIPSCTNLGGSVDNDGVFNSITGNTITLTIPSSLMTCNSTPSPGSPDGDIQQLTDPGQGNSVTIITV